MFWNKKVRERDKLICADTDETPNGDTSVSVKITSKEQIFSAYSYSGDTLNTEFADYVYERAKSVPLKEDLNIKLYSNEDIDADEVKRTMKKYYRAEYGEAKKAIKRNSIFSAVMTVLGVIALVVLILISHFFDDFIVTTIVEIAAWVFIWEAVDCFFLERPALKARCIIIQRIYTAEVITYKLTETN